MTRHFTILAVLAIGSVAIVHAQDVDADGEDKWDVIAEIDADGFPAYVAVSSVFPERRFELVADAGEPLIDAWLPGEHHPGVGVLTYFAGSVGTHELIDVYRAVVIDLGSREVLDSGLAVRYQDAAGSTDSLEQPRWEWTADRLTVDAPGEGTAVLDLPTHDESGADSTDEER